MVTLFRFLRFVFFVSLKPIKLLFVFVYPLFSLLLRLQCFVQRAKNYPDPLLIA